MIKLHEQHIHPLFWEAPGVTANCKLYDEAIKNNYFLLKDGKPLERMFGYLQPPGAVIDFLNPEAKNGGGDTIITWQILDIGESLLIKYPEVVQSTLENTMRHPDQPERIMETREKIAEAIERLQK